MKRIVLLAIAAAALTGAAPRPAASYGAHGTEPFWNLGIARGRIVYTSPDQPTVSVAAPRPTAISHGRRYATRRMTVEITREGDCSDGMSDLLYAETVRIFFGPRRDHPLEGCGGAVLRPHSLENTGWDIVGINGRSFARADNYQFDFNEGRLSGQAGCNRFSGPYRERSGTLIAGPLIATRMACPGQRMADEQAVLRILGGPVRVAFPDGTTMVLASRAGTIRLHRGM